jgi:N-acetylmuramoyl-L-alanine amidase
MAKYIQKTSPNLNIGAKPGWCLQYADDVVNAPVRRESAGLEYLAQRAAGNIHEEEPPVGLWVPVFFDITSGIYDPYEHVGWAYNHGNGRIEIHDSEVHSGARGVYNSLAEIAQWFRIYGLRYLGWSERIGGVQIVEKSDNVRVVTSGVGVNVRYEPTTQSGVFATYPDGSDIEMAGWVYGENVNGDDRWFKSQRSGVYLHFSAFDEKEGSLPNLGDFRNAPQPETKAVVPENKAPEFISFEKEFDFVDEVIPAHVSNQFYGRKNLKDDNGKYFGNIPEDYEIQKKFIEELQRPSSEIKHITIHNTTNTSIQATTNEFRRKESFKSAHLVVSNDKIVQVVPKGNTAFTNGTHEANYEGFTIEFLDDVTDDRYVEVLKKVTKALGVNEIKLHRNWVATQCPYKISDQKFKEILDKVFDRNVEKPVEKVVDNQQLTTTQEKPTVNQELTVEEKPKKETRKLTEEELKIMEEIKNNISEVNNSVEYSPVVSQEVKNKTYFATGWALTAIGTVATISVALLPQHATLILAISGALTGACASINQLYKISSKK